MRCGQKMMEEEKRWVIGRVFDQYQIFTQHSLINATPYYFQVLWSQDKTRSSAQLQTLKIFIYKYNCTSSSSASYSAPSLFRLGSSLMMIEADNKVSEI